MPPSDTETRQVRVHVPRRDLDQRQLDRAAGVDQLGRPTARALGISPRQLVRSHGLTMRQATVASRELLKRAHQEHDRSLRESDDRLH